MFLDTLREKGTAEFFRAGAAYNPNKRNDGKWNYLKGLLPELTLVIHRGENIPDNHAKFSIDPAAKARMKRVRQ